MNLKKLLLCLTLPLYILDQVSKWWIVFEFPEEPLGQYGRVIELAPWFEIIRVHNQGVAFGMGNGTSWAPIVFFFIPMLALVMLRVFWKKGVFNNRPAIIALALLLAGIFGNFTDRLFQGFQLQAYQDQSFWKRLSEGYVVDFISVKLPGYQMISPASGGWWPTFNVADSCVCVAAFLLFLSGILEEKKQKRLRNEGN
jgi:signal peptidase II